LKKAAQLISDIMRTPSVCDDGVIANDLLREFQRGYPIEELTSLLTHQDDTVVKTGVFIASELGRRARPVLEAVVRLLSHPAMAVRYDAIDSVLSCTGSEDGEQVAKVILLLGDTEGPVRRKVLDFISRASRGQLEAALAYFETTQSDSAYASALRALIHKGTRPDEVVSLMRNENAILRMIGVVAAARMGADGVDSLVFARSVGDEDIRRFANDVLALKQLS
jgi:hypothetical protein